MPPQAAPDYLELTDYTAMLRRRWRSASILACVGLALGTSYYLLAPKVYSSTVVVQVNALPQNANVLGGRTGGPVNMDNEAQAVQSAAVGAIASGSLGGNPAIASLEARIQVTVPPNSTFLRIRCDGPLPAVAQQCASAFGRAYLINRRLSNYRLIASGISGLQAQAATLRTSIASLKEKLATAAAAGLSASARASDQLVISGDLAELSSVNSNISSLAPLYASLAAADGSVVGSIATPAALPLRPSSPVAALILPSGLAAGLVIGLAFAFFRDRRDDRVHSAADAERLAALPAIFRLTEKRARPLTSIEPPRSRAGQAFTELAQDVATTLGGGRVILVAGTATGQPSENAASVVAANLGAALARVRGETAVICGDLRGTAIPRLFGFGTGYGLSDVLAGKAKLGEAARRPRGLPGLYVISPGSDTSGTAFVTRYGKVGDLLAQLREHVSYIVIEVQSVGGAAETFCLAEFADAAIPVVQLEQTRGPDLADCAWRLERLRTEVLGIAILPASGPERASGRERQADRDERTPAVPAAAMAQPAPAAPSTRASRPAPPPSASRPAPPPSASRPAPTAGPARYRGPAGGPAEPDAAARS